MTTETFKVEGMSCSHCQAAVTRALQEVPGVDRAEVDLQAQAATVTYDAERVGTRELEAAVDEAGYTLVVA